MIARISLCFSLSLLACTGQAEGGPSVEGHVNELPLGEISADGTVASWGVGNGLTEQDELASWGVGNGRTDSATLAHWGVGNGRTAPADLRVVDPRGVTIAGSLHLDEETRDALQLAFEPEQDLTRAGEYGIFAPDLASPRVTFQLKQQHLAQANASGELLVVIDAP